ncbi:MAG: glycoside hydrolase family 3 protein [Clostridiaceae bacterium]|nr:glycoside hydrolase family 3 protein [Clostridiaceae bacterium]
MRIQLLFFVLITALIFSSCSIQNPSGNTPGNINDNGQIETSSPAPSSSPVVTKKPLKDVDEIINLLTLEEKIGQMFFIAKRTKDDGQWQLSFDKNLRRIIETYKPGGFIFFQENLDTISQTQSFIEDLQNASSIPMFIGIDEEGGIVTRLNKAENLHSTIMPEPYTIGATKNPQNAYDVSKAISREIKSLGFNLNFAPVADVFSNPKNRVIGKRAYSSDPDLASRMVTEAVNATVESGIIPVIKHFPGHGDTLQDSHTGIAIVENDIERLRSFELLPFRAGIEAGVPMVMTAHVLTPHITDDELPATLSKTMLEDILRNELEFDGIIITDGLEMSAISSYFSEEEAVVMAMNAGVDILLLPKNLENAYDALLTAVKQGKISEERINASVRRILKVKLDYIFDAPENNLNPKDVLGCEEHKKLAEKIREESTQ